MPLRFLIDEDTRAESLWHAITQHNATSQDEGIDALRVGDPDGPDLGMLDPDLLKRSVASGRIIVSQDRNTLIHHHQVLIDGGQPTPGLLIIRRGAKIQDIVEFLALASHYSEAQEWAGTHHFIPP
jgi:hypothetical protein